mgnify:CR=1 FL=1
MARKNYQVKAKDGACWEKIHHSLCCTTHSQLNIPDRECLCKNDIAYDETRGTYQLSIAEVEELREHPDILWVQLDPEWHPEVRPTEDATAAVRFGKNVKNYRSIVKNTTTPEPGTKTEVANSLTMADLQGSDTNNWVLVKTIHPNTAALNYWASKQFPLIVDYGMYPSAPATPSEPDPLRNTLQTAFNDITITQAGYYELEIAADGAEAYVSTSGPGSASHAEIPVRPGRSEPGNGIGDRAGIRYDVIQLGKLTTGTLRINTKIKNGSHPDPAKDTWDQNPGCIAWKLYYLGNPTMSAFWMAGQGTVSQIPASLNSDNTDNVPWPSVTSADLNRTGYQLKRCEEGATNAWGSDSNQVLSTDITYTNDGTDIDVVVVDNGVWSGHPEFVTDSADPQHYISGNALSRHGRCGVLDVILDGPYYMDPDYFNADPANRLVTRWDGTIVPNETTARNWWFSPLLRSPSMPQNIGSLTIPATYTRDGCMGSEYTPPSNGTAGGHGTPCASLAYGKNYGWAFNCNKWQIEIEIGGNSAGPMPVATFPVALKIFHENKPTNPKHGTQDPTVVSGSYYYRHDYGKSPKYVGNESTGQSYNDGVGTSGTMEYTYQGTSGTKTRDISLLSDPDVGSFIRGEAMLPGFVAGMKPIGYTSPFFYFARQDASVPNGDMSVAIENHINSINAGIIWCLAAGNEGAYISALDDPNINNRVNSATLIDNDIDNDPACGWTHRASFPASVSYGRAFYEPNSYTDTQGHEQFIIGAIDDKVKSRWTPITDVFWKDSSTNTWGSEHSETIAMSYHNRGINQYAKPDLYYLNNNSQPVVWSTERDYWENKQNIDYSNRGTLIDFWAPADSTLAATSNKSSNEPSNLAKNYTNPSPRPCSGGTYQDAPFSGTSAACPVAAGILACNMQQNRGWNTKQLKDHMKSVTPNADFYKGPVPNGVDDRAHWAYCSNQGIDAKIIQERSDSKTTPNTSYETTNGIAPSRPNLNERFSITTSGTSVTIKIVSIREFSSSDAGSPTELRIANGWYPIQIVSTSTSSGTLANYKMRIKSGSNDQVLEISSDGGSFWNGFNISTVNGNFQTDGSGRFWYYLNVDDSVGLPQQPSNPTYVINLSPSTNVNEGSTLVTTITTTDVSNGTTLYWRLDGTGITSADFSSGSLTGSGSVNSQGSFQFSHTLANDLTTEGIETLNVKLFTDAARQIQVASTSIQINDTSVAQAYAISPSKTTPNEGESFTYGIGTSGVVNGTTLYWEITGSVMSSADFTPSSLTGSVTINNNSAAVTKTINEDLVTEGNERINFKVYTDAGRTNEVASNNSVVIQDTSTAPTTPTYNITPSNTTLDEGDSFTITVTTTNVSPGTTLYWKINEETGNISTSDIVGGTLDGSASVNSQGTFLFSKTLADDITTEGEEKFTVKLYTDATFNLLVASTPDITINDTSQSKTYSLSASSTTINEGSTVTTTVTTTNVSSGTALYWELSGTGITSSDFSSGSLTGSGSVNAQGTFNFSHTLDNDVTLEGSETIAVRLYTDSGRTTQVGNTLSIVVNDTSIPQATYSISPNPTSVNEGSSFTTTVTTSNVANGTTLYWALEGTNIDGNDFSTGALSGSGSISNNTFNFTHTLSSDATTEGTETCSVKLYVDSARTVKVAEASVTINDTSQTPSTPTYVISPSNTSINEGETFTTTVTTSNVADGTTLYWQLDQHTGTINAGDFSSGALNGSGTTSSSQFNFQHTVAADTTTEGEEKFAIVLATDAGFNNIVATSALITINDTSTDSATPTYALSSNLDPVNEGQFLAITVTTTNVASNTTLYWQFSGTNITASDFNEGTLESNIVTDATGSKAFGTTLRNDILTEGSETMLVKLFTDSGRTTQVGNTLSITINDTSTSQAPTYSVSPSVTQLNEGQSFTTTVTTTNINDGTTLYWVVESHTGTINAGDFSSGALSGSGSISSGGFAFSHTIAEDATTEGTEKILIKLYTDSGLTNNVANTSVITIFDTSTTSNPVYVLSTPESIIKEGDTFTTTVATTNVVDSTDLWWKLEGINSSDLTTGSIEGQGTVISNTFSFSHALAKDMAEEGTEIIQIKLYSDSARNNQVGNTLGVSVKDTSQPGFNVDVTAPNNNEYILIGNDTDGTI